MDPGSLGVSLSVVGWTALRAAGGISRDSRSGNVSGCEPQTAQNANSRSAATEQALLRRSWLEGHHDEWARC